MLISWDHHKKPKPIKTREMVADLLQFLKCTSRSCGSVHEVSLPQHITSQWALLLIFHSSTAENGYPFFHKSTSMEGWKITGILIGILASPCSPSGAEEWATASADLHLKAWVYKTKAPFAQEVPQYNFPQATTGGRLACKKRKEERGKAL